MTSLCPGPLFGTPGLNHYSTPSSRTDTPSDIQGRFSRIPFNGIPWPKPSPVSKVYDVRNSSTKMILLNNKYTKKACRLRGQTLNDGEVKAPQPERHSAETPYVNRKSHVDCGNSSSPVFKPEVKANLKWANSTQRPPIKFEDGSSVNYKRHTTCMVSDDLRGMNWHRPRRPYSTSIIRESMRSRSPLLDDLNPGERLYMYSIAKVYSVDSMRKLKQSQYCHLLHREIERGIYTNEECERYWKYLSRPRKTQQGANDTYQRRRIRSAPSQRPGDKNTERSQSRQTTGRPSETSQSTRSKSRASSRPISRASAVSSKKKPQEKTPNATKSDNTESKSVKTATSKRRRQKEDPKHKEIVTDNPVDESEDDDSSHNEAQVRGEDKVKDTEKSDDEEQETLRGARHKEGKDRPKSRLGGRNKRNMDNSDDDYSSESSISSSDESDTDNTTSKSKSTSEPTKSSKSFKSSKKQHDEKPKKVTETMAPPPTDDKNNASYSEDFTETSASESASHPKGGKSDDTKEQTDNSVSETTATITESKTSSESTTSRSHEKAGEHSNMSASESTSAQQTSAIETTENSSSLKPPAQAGKSSSDTDDTTDTSTSEDVSKSSSSQQKVKDSEEVKVSGNEVKASDESYSDDFTGSRSQEDDKQREKSEKDDDGDKSTPTRDQSLEEKDSKMTKDVKGSGGTSHEKRRDSVEIDRDERVRDWDKIEY